MNMALQCARDVFVQYLKIQVVADQENIAKNVMKRGKKDYR